MQFPFTLIFPDLYFVLDYFDKRVNSISEILFLDCE